MQRRWSVLLFSIAAILMLVFLAAGISNVEFTPPKPLNFEEGEYTPVQDTFEFIKRDVAEVPLGEQVIVVVLLFILLALTIMLLPEHVRKRLLKALVRAALIAIALFYYFDNYEMLDSPLSRDIAEPFSADSSSEVVDIPPTVYKPKPVPPAVAYTVSVVIVLVVVVIGWRFLRPWLFPKEELEMPLQDFANIARKSLGDLSDGQQWEDVIVRTYMRMSEVAGDRRGLLRQEAMTPREFAARLERAGLPVSPVQNLTRLFEKVRYGGKSAKHSEIAEAKRCLKAIVAACGKTR